MTHLFCSGIRTVHCFFLAAGERSGYNPKLEESASLRALKCRSRVATKARYGRRTGWEKSMDDAGQKLKRARERLNLRYRDVEEASLRIADRHKNEEFIIALSRLSDIENKGTVPTIYRLYSLCAIYRLNLSDALRWYGVDPTGISADSAAIPLGETHQVGNLSDGDGQVQIPLAL